MHVAFIPYGNRKEVEELLRDMESQKHKMLMTKGKEKKELWVTPQIRILPFGVYEYVFPKEELDAVLTSLDFGIPKNRYQIPNLYLSVLRKILKLKPCPKFDNSKKFLWLREHVNIIPLGVRYDVDIVGQHDLDKGWTHEAL